MNTLSQIQNEINVPKNRFNAFGKYKYRSCEDIVEAVKPVLAKYGFSIIITDDIVQVGERIYVKATATITDCRALKFEATGWAREEESKKGMDGSQVTGAASSYARKYALNGLFAIDDSQDSDATNVSEPKPAKKVEAEPEPLENRKMRLRVIAEEFKPKLNGKFDACIAAINAAAGVDELTVIYNHLKTLK
jgi:hypothetical protein